MGSKSNDQPATARLFAYRRARDAIGQTLTQVGVMRDSHDAPALRALRTKKAHRSGGVGPSIELNGIWQIVAAVNHVAVQMRSNITRIG